MDSRVSFIRAINKDKSGPGGASGVREIRRARITAPSGGYETLIFTPECGSDTLSPDLEINAL